MRHLLLVAVCVVVSMALLSCGGATAKGNSVGTAATGASGGSGSGGSGSTGGTAGSGGSGGSGASSPIVIQSFTKPVRLGGGGGADQENLAVDAQGNLNLAVAHRPGLDPLYSVNFLRFTPHATEMTADTTLPPFALNPQIAGDSSGNIYLSWAAAPSTSPNPPAFLTGAFSRSNDGGQTFTTPVDIFTAGGFGHMALDSAGDIFEVWATANPGAPSQTIMFSRSTDGGKTFPSGPPLSDASKIAQAPHLAVTSTGRIDVIWQYGNGQPCDSSNGFSKCSPCDIFFTQSANGGTSFSAPENVSNSSGCAGLDGSYQNEQQMQIDSSGNVNIVWDDSIAGVMFRRSTDGGSTFLAPTIVTPAQGIFPKIVVDASGNIDVIWAPADASAAVVFSRSTDGGAKFSSPIPMGAGETGSNPQLAVDGSGDIDVLWAESHAIRFSQSFDGGKTFSSPVSVSTDTTDLSDVSPDILPSTQVHMVVEANGTVDLAFGTDQFAGNDQIYLWFSHGATSSKAPAPPLFLSECCSDGTVGKAYTGDAMATGGTPAYSLTVTSLPPGLSLQNPSSGGAGTDWPILGTPTTAGTFVATFTLTDSAGLSLKKTFTITIAP